MKKVFIPFFLLLIVANLSYCLEPVRISATTNPNLTANFTIDLLESNGAPVLTAYSDAAKSSGPTGILSVIVQGGGWAGIEYSDDYLVRVTFGGTVLSIERLDVVIGKQSLYGATISSDDIDQTNQVAFKSLALSGDLNISGTTTANNLNVSGTATLKKTVGNVMNLTLTSDLTNFDLAGSNGNTLILNVTGYSNGASDIFNLLNPQEGQILMIHYIDPNLADVDRLSINDTNLLTSDYLRIIVYIDSAWHPISSTIEF